MLQTSSYTVSLPANAQQPFLLAQGQTYPDAPRGTADPFAQGTRTFDTHGGSAPVSVDSQNNPIFSSTVYWVIAVLIIGLVALGYVLKRAPRPVPPPPGDAEGSRAHPL